MVDRTTMIALRLTPDERRMLTEIAEHEGENQSVVLRTWIRKAHAKLFGPPTPKPKRKKR